MGLRQTACQHGSSADPAALGMICRSFSNMTSMVARHSWQFGTAVFITKSFKNLPSVIINPGVQHKETFRVYAKQMRDP